MTEKKLVEEIVKELDYDIWKELFYHNLDDPFAYDTIDKMIDLVKKYDKSKTVKAKKAIKNLGRKIKPKRK